VPSFTSLVVSTVGPGQRDLRPRTIKKDEDKVVKNSRAAFHSRAAFLDIRKNRYLATQSVRIRYRCVEK